MFYDMLQILVSFGLGVYVGETYEMRPHINALKAYLSQFEKKKDIPPPPPAAKTNSWFSWSKDKSTITENIKKE